MSFTSTRRSLLKADLARKKKRWSKKCIKRRRKDYRGVAERLKALKELIPSSEKRKEEPMEVVSLLEDTADFILLLRTQVVALRQFLDLFSPSVEKY